MANYTGFTYGQIVNHVANYVGNDSDEFKSYVQELITMAELRYFKMHDWSFLHKNNLPLQLVEGVNEYALDSSTIGFFMAAADVESIRCVESNRYLRKMDLTELRRMDPDSESGGNQSYPKAWATAGDNRIFVWPVTTKLVELKVDGKITPVLESPDASNLDFNANGPEIPLRYQEAFIEYVKAQALDRENDDRAPLKKQEALLLMRQDISADMQNLGDAENPRIRSMFELQPTETDHEPFGSGIDPTTPQSSNMKLTTKLNVTGTVAIQDGDYFLSCDTSGAPVTLFLPKASAAGVGKTYIIKDEAGNSATNNIVINASPTEFIDGKNSYIIRTNFESITLVSTGYSWKLV